MLVSFWKVARFVFAIVLFRSAEVETLYVADFEEDVIVRTHSESHSVYIESVPVVALYAPVITLSGLLDGARRVLLSFLGIREPEIAG